MLVSLQVSACEEDKFFGVRQDGNPMVAAAGGGRGGVEQVSNAPVAAPAANLPVCEHDTDSGCGDVCYSNDDCSCSGSDRSSAEGGEPTGRNSLTCAIARLKLLREL